ncbi:MAG: extracellular solute-binding protein [Acidimicrobiia bacterium]|nr:extracellular solute-binding protein [Acidimicrobiia bacterium]
MTNYRTSRTATIVVTALVIGLAACVPGGGGEEATDGTTGEVSTELSSEEVTLEMSFIDAPDMVDQLVTAFTEENPQVTINHEFTTFADYVRQISLAMTSDTAPDIAQYNPGAFKDLIAEGEVLDLDPYSDAYGWTDSFPTVSLEQLMSDENAQVYGEGNLYAVPGGLSLTGLFYNKSVAEDLGISEMPQTIEDLETVLRTALDGGVTPIMVGALDSAGIHMWGALVNVYMAPGEYREWVNGVPEGNINTPEALSATEKFSEWAAAGYYNESANGIGQADATAQFAAGESLFLINGNWAAAQINQEMGDEAGFIAFPRVDVGNPVMGNGFSVSYSISSRSENTNAAAAFLEFLATDTAAPIVAENGFLPPNPDAAPDQTGVLGELTSEFQRVAEDEGINSFPDFAAPEILDELVSGIQSMIANREQPEAFLENIQEIRDSYINEQ